MSYTPQPGTFPARVVEYLRSLPAGAERSSAELAEALGQENVMVAPMLAHGRAVGAVRARKEGRLLYWSLGDGTPPAAPLDNVPDEPLHPAPAIPKKAAVVFPAPIPSAAARAPTGFRAALWTNGTLEIHRDGDLILLTANEAEQLRDLMRGMP